MHRGHCVCVRQADSLLSPINMGIVNQVLGLIITTNKNSTSGHALSAEVWEVFAQFRQGDTVGRRPEMASDGLCQRVVEPAAPPALQVERLEVCFKQRQALRNILILPRPKIRYSFRVVPCSAGLGLASW